MDSPQKHNSILSPDYLQSFNSAEPLLPRTSPSSGMHPFLNGFEVPQWRKFAIHAALCALSYPFLLVFVIISRGKSLFWARLFVGAGCGLIGFMLGISLSALARRFWEAATWATVIHRSQVPQSSGIRLADLAAQSEGTTGSWPALRLLWDRQKYRKAYDNRIWSLWIVFFLFNIVLSSTLSFIFGRVVDISTQVQQQTTTYSEVAVQADLSDDDLRRADAAQNDLNNYALTWTLSAFSVHSLSEAISLTWGNAPVYFAEILTSQLVPGGTGFGTFMANATSPSGNLESQGNMHSKKASAISVQPGSVLRFPRWGIRIKCTNISNAHTNILPVSENNLTYIFTPRDTLQPLFDNFQMQLPEALQMPLNFTQAMYGNDTVPSALNTSDIAMAAYFWNNGVSYSIKSTSLSMGNDGNGFVTIETIAIRLNDTYAPNGTFGVKGDPILDNAGLKTRIGYDAVVCLELYEPWVLELYNSSTSSPTSMRIVDKAAEIKDMNTQFADERRVGEVISDPLVKRVLNSTGFTGAYIAAHQNSVNQMLKDNGRDADYVPSPTLLSFTNGGSGAYDYTELSSSYYAQARALGDASNVLPYFAGSGQVVARSYTDQVITDVNVNNLDMAIILALLLAMGFVSALFVPKLPLSVPRRGFDLYSWFSAFYLHELVPESADTFSRRMDLDQIKTQAGELEFRFTGLIQREENKGIHRIRPKPSLHD